MGVSLYREELGFVVETLKTAYHTLHPAIERMRSPELAMEGGHLVTILIKWGWLYEKVVEGAVILNDLPRDEFKADLQTAGNSLRIAKQMAILADDESLEEELTRVMQDFEILDAPLDTSRPEVMSLKVYGQMLKDEQEQGAA